MNRARVTSFLLAFLLWATPAAEVFAARTGSASSAIENAKRLAEGQLRRLVEPLVEKYGGDDVKIMSVSATVDLATPEELEPGFSDSDPGLQARLVPTDGTIKLLMDEKLGPVTRRKLLDLMQQYLDTLEYPVKVQVQTVPFPQPAGTAGKVAEIRERVSRQFKERVDSIFQQFCPQHCLLADFELLTDAVNPEEAQYGQPGEYVESGGAAVRIRGIHATLLADEVMSPEERTSLLEMARLKTNDFRNVTLGLRAMKFPRTPEEIAATEREGGRSPAGKSSALSLSEKNSTDTFKQEQTNETKQVENVSTHSNETLSSTDATQTNQKSETNKTSDQREEHYTRVEKIERVESGDAVQAELKAFRNHALIFACVVLAVLFFIAFAVLLPKGHDLNPLRFLRKAAEDEDTGPSEPVERSTTGPASGAGASSERARLVALRYEIQRLQDELLAVFSEQPKVAKLVFSRILSEEGVETTSAYIQIFGESVVMDMLRDPSLQADLNELMEFYAKNPTELKDEEKHDLLRRLHNRTVASKMVIMGSRTSGQFEFLAEMDGPQILELVRNESITVKAIILTQCESQKRTAIYSQLDEETRMKLLSELGRIDYLPRDYISNVASALRRKRQDNPRLNTEALPGSEVLITLLERSTSELQSTLMRNLQRTNPDTARNVKAKLVTVNTLEFLKDSQMLEVVLSLRHDELVAFLKGVPEMVRKAIYSKAPKDLAEELDEEVQALAPITKDTYQNLERRVINRIKLMANDGQINLTETNDRLFHDPMTDSTRIMRGA